MIVLLGIVMRGRWRMRHRRSIRRLLSNSPFEIAALRRLALPATAAEV
jgi:hypothetical protein